MTARSRPSELLVPVAKEAAKSILNIAQAKRSSEGSTIATSFHLIATDLTNRPLHQISSEEQELCLRALSDLHSICTWASSPSSYEVNQATPQDIYDILVRKFQSKSSQDEMFYSIEKFLDQKTYIIKHYQDGLTILSTKLSLGNQISTDNTFEQQPRDEDVYPDHVNRCLVDVLKEHSICRLASHPATSKDMKWHHIRICLSTGVLTNKQLAQAEIIIAANGMTFWQEISFCVSQQQDDGNCSKHTGEDSLDLDDEADRSEEPVRMIQGALCQMLDEQSYSRIRLQLDDNCRLYKYPDRKTLDYFTSPGHGESLSYILSNGNLTVGHKIALAYKIARASWQFYTSDLMHAKWTSDDIWFMPTEPNDQSKTQIPLRAFLSLPFEKTNPYLAEDLEKSDYTHRYPRILFLGIVLLEIGLGQSLKIEPFESSSLSLVAYINRAHSKAIMRLREFEKMSWDDFSSKAEFDKAISKCLDCQSFKDVHKIRMKRQTQDQQGSEQLPIAVARVPIERRRALYQEVVAPLRWLAEVGFESSRDIQFITVSRVQRPEATLMNDAEYQAFRNELKKPTFNTSGPGIQSGCWMDRLKVINSYVLRCRKSAGVTSPIKVAILDTGCNRDLPFFKNNNISECFKDWKDFGAESQTSVDTFGHGTFMACLLLHVAPIVNLYVARIAVTQDELELNEDKIIQAIEYAGLTWNVDVLSMSFSFTKPSTAISDAIENVRKKRTKRIIFFASAGNSSSDRGEAYPAQNPHVISIYASDSQGTFLKSNPTSSRDGPRPLGTYGDDVPNSIIDEMNRFFPNKDFSPGTSIATAVATGIAATMLSYAAALPGLLQINGFGEVLERLKTARGMMSMLRVMSQNTDYRGDFINPIRFWSEISKDLDVFFKICHAVANVSIAEDP